MAKVLAHGVALEVERFGDPAGDVLLMIRGLGSQIIHWPGSMIDAFVAAGLHVVVYDNRDAGLSQKFPDGPEYSLDDMAADGLGVLDALGIERAHVLGISMGGGILQRMLLAAPERIITATIVFSSTWAANLPGRTPEAEALLLSDPGDPAVDREAVIDQLFRADRVWAGPAFLFDEGERRALISRAIDRCYAPDGVARQYAAIMATPTVAERLAEVRTPTLVVHGECDALLPAEHGRDIARRIPGARYVEIAGMGHDLDGGAGEIVAAEVIGFLGAHRAG